MTSNGVVLAFDPVVLADQQLLQRGGYYRAAPNGYTDAVFEAAVRAARAAYGFPPGVFVDAPLRAKLQQITVLTPDPVFPREGPRIQEAQQALRDLGVYRGAVSGFPDAEFDAALRNFQIRERLPSYPRSPTPILDDAALARLQARVAEARSRGMAPPASGTPPVATVPGSPPPQAPPPMGPPVGFPPSMPPGTSTTSTTAPGGGAAPMVSSPSIATPIAIALGAIALATWGSYLFTRIR